jgi:DNA-binding CsgD family transcriptional regulator
VAQVLVEAKPYVRKGIPPRALSRQTKEKHRHSSYGVHVPAVHGLVGRDAELTRLTELVDALTRGTGRAVLVEGEPGIGKSSLVRAAMALAEQQDCRVHWAAADELGRALPLRPVLDAFRGLDPVDVPRLATLRRLLRGEVLTDVEPTAAASEQVFALVAELAAATPTVLVVDDLQWADQMTIAVWERLALSVSRLPLLLIGVLRPVPERDEIRTLRRTADGSLVIRLSGLRDVAATSLLTGLAGGQPGPGLLGVASSASGNPLYLKELVAALVRAGRVVVNAGVAELARGPVPGTLLGAIADRLDFLPRGVRTTLRAAALLEVEFGVGDLAIVVNRRVPDLVPDIDHATAAGVLVEAGERLSFRHPVIRAALYDEMAPAVRQAWHRDAARAFVTAGVPVHRIARQLLQTISGADEGPLDDLLSDWLADNAPALVAQAPRAAVDLLRQACRGAPVTTRRGARLASRLAEALFQSGDHAEAERIARHAMEVVPDTDLLVDLHWTTAQCGAFTGQTEKVLTALSRAIALPEVSDRHRARLLVMAARAHRARGEVILAGEVATTALATAEEIGDIWTIGWSLHVLIVVSMMRGDVAAALPMFERALDVVGDDPALTDLGLLLRINRAIALGDLDRYGEALDAAAHVRQLADRAGNLVRLAQARCALGELEFETGQWDEALVEVEALPDEVKDAGVRCCGRGIAAVIAFHRGDVEEARRHLRLVAPSAERLGNRVVASLTLARSLDHELADEPGEALEVLTVCLGQAEELDEMEDLLPEAARLAAATGASDVLADVVARAGTIADRSRVPHRLGAAAYCRGLADDSPTVLLLAAEQYQQAGLPLPRARALEAAAIGFAERGDLDAARSAFTRADEHFDSLGASWDVGRLRAALRRYGIRRGPRARHRRASTGWDSLTTAELKVATLVAEGLSNREIAERLVVSVRTVETHMSHILGKLGMRSRVDVARARVSHGRGHPGA